MSEGNVLSGGLDELEAIKQTLEELEKSKVQNAELTQKEAKLEKQIAAMEKELADKIASVTRTRKSELETVYDEQLEATKNRQKKVRSKKDKLKTSKVSERIKQETAQLREEGKRLKDEIRGVYKSDKIPRVLNRDYFHAIYQPVGVRDILMIIISLVVVLFVIPCGVYYLLLPSTSKTIFALVVTYIVTVLVFGAIYFFLGWTTKEKHPEAFRKIRDIRRQVVKNRRDIRAMERKIRKDKDESGYGLDKFNKELSELDGEMDALEEEKKTAVRKFENETKKVIADEVSAEFAKELDELRREHEETYNSQREAEDKIKALTRTITDKYSPYIGKENLDIALLDRLGEILQAKEAATIGEALGLYRSKKEAPEKT